MVQALPTSASSAVSLGARRLLGTEHTTQNERSGIFPHLMKYREGRFANHARIRYVAHNWIQRWCAIKQRTFCISRNGILQDKTAEQLNQTLWAAPALAKQIVFYASKLRGTRAYDGNDNIWSIR